MYIAKPLECACTRSFRNPAVLIKPGETRVDRGHLHTHREVNRCFKLAMYVIAYVKRVILGLSVISGNRTARRAARRTAGTVTSGH